MHRARLDALDPALALLLERNAVLSIEDYGSFLFVTFDERPAGGRGVLQTLGSALRDEEAIVAFNGLALDTADSAALATLLASVPAALRAGAGPFVSPSGRELKVVQFAGPIKDAWVDALESTGARIVAYVAFNAYVVAADAPSLLMLETFRERPEVQWVGDYEPCFRLAPELRPLALAKGLETSDVTIQLLADEEAFPLLVGLFEAHLEELRPPSFVLGYVNVHFRVPHEFLALLASHPSVFAIEPLPRETLLDESQAQIMAGNLTLGGAGPSGPGYLSWLASKGFAGSTFGFAIDITDDGVDRGSTTDVNVEFRAGGAVTGSSRVVYNNNCTNDASADSARGHGNLNASIAGGYNALTGSSYEDISGYNYGLGICPFALIGNTKVFSNSTTGSGFLQATTTRLATAYNGGARISSNSWSYTSGNNYNYDCQAHDAVVRDVLSSTAGNQQMTIVFAAGNAGPASNTVRPPATAKNVIAVGAGENYRPSGTDGCGMSPLEANSANDLANFSSRGPTADLRKKPEIVAPGTHVQGAASRSPSYGGAGVCNAYWPSGQTLYCWSSGTSHATPAVAGAAALVRQYFVNQGLAAPSPAMIKATLLASARYQTGSGANDTLWSNSQGLGGVDLGRVFNGVAAIRSDQTQLLASTGQTYTVSGAIATPSEPFRVAVVWTDPPGPTTGNAWVNNLDLEVTVNGALYRGNVFSGATSITGGAADPRNNAEVVFLPAGTTGSFTVVVRATNIAGDGVPGNGDTTDQDFALVVQNATGSAPANPDFSLAASPSSQTIAKGQSTAYTVANTATGGFGSPVSLSVAPAISGVTYSLSPNPMAPNGSATLSVATSTSVAAGTYTLTITGTGGGLTRTATVALTVTASADFSLSASPSSRTVAKGQSTTYTVSNTGTGGFASSVSLSLTPAISGVTHAFSPNPMAPNGSATLTISTSTSAASGTHTLTITGTGGGLTRTTTATLTITASADFSLATSPSAQTVANGQSISYTVTNTATTGFTSSISLSVAPAISGVTYAFAPSSIGPNGSATLNVSASTSAAAGTHTLTITGTGGGLSRTASVTLTISAPQAGQVKTYSVAPNVGIPDNATAGALSSISVPIAQTITSISVGVAVTHGAIGQLKVTLIAPNGAQRLLHNLTGGAADNLATTYPVITTPAEPLSTLNGLGTAGTWSLKVQDQAAGEVGALNSWTITFNGEKSSTQAIGIPDANTTGVTSTLNFAATGVVASVKVRVAITHPYRGDLEVKLVAPDGTQVLLHNRTGGATANLATEYPDLTAPAAALSAFNGKSIAGNWSLKVRDLVSKNTGTLTSWSLSLTAP